MNSKYILLIVVPSLITLTGCASWQAPGPDLASRVPVVKIGQAKPATDDYILLVTSGQDYPVRMNVDGSFLTKKGSAETTVRVNRDVYLYKHWTSFDGKHWQRGQFAFSVAIGLEPEAGKVEIKVDEKK